MQQLSPEHAAALRMKPSDHDQFIPRILLRAMAGLVVVVLVLTSYAVITDRPHEAQVHTAPVEKSILIQIKEADRGNVQVYDMNDTLLASSSDKASGFIAVVQNSLRFQRRKHGITENHPVTLIRFADGRLGLRDDATGWKIHLTGFGQDNARAWAAILAN